MHTGMLHLHSALRWILIVLLVVALIKTLAGWLGNKPFTNGDKKLHLFLMIATHMQFLLGLVLIFVSPDVQELFSNFKENIKIPTYGFWVSHMFYMFLAVVLITIGRRTTKKGDDKKRHRNAFIFYLFGALMIALGIPYFRGWF